MEYLRTRVGKFWRLQKEVCLKLFRLFRTTCGTPSDADVLSLSYCQCVAPTFDVMRPVNFSVGGAILEFHCFSLFPAAPVSFLLIFTDAPFQSFLQNQIFGRVGSWSEVQTEACEDLPIRETFGPNGRMCRGRTRKATVAYRTLIR